MSNNVFDLFVNAKLNYVESKVKPVFLEFDEAIVPEILITKQYKMKMLAQRAMSSTVATQKTVSNELARFANRYPGLIVGKEDEYLAEFAM